ncbi:MAG: hypothetical protein JOZ81_21785 [Chloroflexi bacterium]|nr:hypothetical protein [Chloroflexota bacterium]
MDQSWLIAIIAIVAFVAVGCGTPTERSMGPVEQATVQGEPTPVSIANAAPAVANAVPAPVPVAPAHLAVAPQPAPQAGTVQLSGDGFSPDETVAISTDNAQLGTGMTKDDGSFDALPITLSDQLQSGSHALTATGQTSGRAANATLWIRAPKPWLVADSYDVPQYGDLGFVAGGFEPMDEVTVSLQPDSGAALQLVTLTTDQAGNAPWTQTKVPQLAAGTYSIVLSGQADGSELRRDLHVTPLKPLTELSPWAGPPGVPVQFNAKGFAPNEQIHVQLGGTQDPTTLQADEYGNLWAAGPVHIPQTAASGELQLTLLGAASGATSTATFKVLEPKPWLELTSWSGAPGAPVGFGGGGWIGGEKVDIHLGSATNTVQKVTAADDNGWLKSNDQVYVPNDVADDVIFVAVGEQSHLVAAATFKVVFPFGLHPEAKPGD